MNLINGKKIADEILDGLNKEIEETGIKPCLGVILAGDDPASQIYIQKKEEAARRIGAKVNKLALSQDASEEDILKVVEMFNQNEEINGILVQLPLPEGISREKVIQSIELKKDVDGFLEKSRFESPFILAIQKALEATGEEIRNKKAIALVNSDIFGEKLKSKLNIDYQVGFTEDLKEFDIIITALGQPEIVKGSMIEDNCILIDGGISKKNGKITGDVDKESVRGKVSWLSPVPGGLGPLTVAFLLKNLVLAAVSRGLFIKDVP